MFHLLYPTEKDAPLPPQKTTTSKTDRVEKVIEKSPDAASGDEGISKAGDIITRCSFERIGRILSVMSPDQKEVAAITGFGSLMRIDGPSTNSSLIQWLVKNVDTTDNKLCIYGKEFYINAAAFERVMNIKDGGTKIKMTGPLPKTDLVNAVVGKECSVCLRKLEKDLRESQDADDLFIARFSLACIGSILCPMAGNKVSASYMKVLHDVNSIALKDWATFCVRFLMESIRKFQVGGYKYLSGCLIFLQVSYLSFNCSSYD